MGLFILTSRRGFLRSFSWVLLCWLAVEAFSGSSKKPEDSRDIHTSAAPDLARAQAPVYTAIYGVFVLVAHVFLYICLFKSEQELAEIELDFLSDMAQGRNSWKKRDYRLKLRLAIQVISPLFCLGQYVFAFSTYYDVDVYTFGKFPSETAPLPLGVLLLLAVYSIMEGMAQVGYCLMSCCFYRTKWYINSFSSHTVFVEIYSGTLPFDISNYADWDCFLYLAARNPIGCNIGMGDMES